MKKLITIFCVLMLSAPAFAQFSYGVKADITFTSVENEDGETGYSVGLVGEYRFNYLFSLQLEAAYSSQLNYEGHKITFDENMCMTVEGLRKFHYIDIPLLFKVHVLSGLSLDVGPQLGFVMGKKFRETWVDTGDGGFFDKSDNGTYKSLETGLAVGISYRFSRRMETSARYNFGLTNVAKIGDKWSKNGVFQIGLGYRFK